jgi:formylglycine-generating enzyme required for sulfatase activity
MSRRSYFETFQVLFIGGLIIGSLLLVGAGRNVEAGDIPSKMILIEGGTFEMGDVFGEGNGNEVPVHTVEIDDFYLAALEVTVGEFRAFVKETGYKTSAEGPVDEAAQKSIIEKAMSGKLSKEEMKQLSAQFLEYGGTYYWDGDIGTFGFDAAINWANPGFEQNDKHPAMCLSWNDAAGYCNWLSRKEGLPLAYDIETGSLLDENGDVTTDISLVKGYRMPTESEWEYAAREGGKKVRFGNGKNTARSSEINFHAAGGDYSYNEPGEYRDKTTEVGIFKPNRLGLYDMSGNAWEWCSDNLGIYTEESQTNPYGKNAGSRILRGGRWGGDAKSVRVFSRFPYECNNRCNNSGFRIARSK